MFISELEQKPKKNDDLELGDNELMVRLTSFRGLTLARIVRKSPKRRTLYLTNILEEAK